MTGTAPQRPKADPKKDVCPNCGEVANGCNYCRKTPAPVPQTEGEKVSKVPAECPCADCRKWRERQTEGECPDCGGQGEIEGKIGSLSAGGFFCPTCSGTGKEKA